MELEDFSKLSHTLPFTINGSWWLLGKSRRKVSGELQFRCSDVPILRLDGSFGLSPWHELRHRGKMDIIFGETTAGNLVSLHRCYSKTNGSRESKYGVNIILLGGHVRSLDSFKLKEATFSTTNLERWVGVEPYEISKSVISPRQSAAKQFHIPYLKVTIGIGSSLSMDHEFLGAASMSYQNAIFFYAAKPMQWKRANQIVSRISNLLMLLSGEPHLTRQLYGTPVVMQLAHKLGSRRRGDVYIFRPFTEQTTASKLYPHEMLFPFSAVESRFAYICDRWFRSWKRLRRVYEVFFTEFRTHSHFLEGRFFHVAQCLEAFHRSWIEGRAGKIVSKPRFKKLHGEIVASLPVKLPNKMKEAIDRVLWQVNDLSFLDRIEELLGMLEPETARLITDDAKWFARAIRDTRNSFTHLQASKRSKVLPVDQWYTAITMMNKLMFIHLLKICGFAETEIRDRLIRGSALYGGPLVRPEQLKGTS